jgi:hypothetical protein
MSISPFSAHRASPEGESRRARLALIAAAVGIAATLLAYAVSPGVRHAVRHAEHSVKHAVSHVFERHHKPVHGTPRLHLVQPLHHPHSKSSPARGRHRAHSPPASPNQAAPPGVASPTG